VSFQTLSGTGAVRLGAEFLARFRKSIAYISNPTWGNHTAIFKDCGFEVREYNYWNPATKGLNWESFSNTLEVF
jgi:aspartate aminotransferase